MCPLGVLIGDEEQDPCYSPQKALTLALTDWLQEFLVADHPGGTEICVLLQREAIWVDSLTLPGFRPPGHLKKGSSDEEPMQMDMGGSPHTPEPEEKPLYTAEPLTLDDLKLLSDLFYLPYEHGRTARKMLQELDWLKNHSVAASGDTEEVG